MLGPSRFFPLGLNTIKLVLSTLRDSLLAFSQFTTLVSSVFISFYFILSLVTVIKHSATTHGELYLKLNNDKNTFI